LRFYQLGTTATFLADQGRDAIIIKRITTLEHLTAIGASTSVGNVYLGPFYYYFIAPWLLLFNFNPAGLAYGVAFFSTLFLLVLYYVAKDLFNKTTAVISVFLATFSYSLIELSRFSWNPNLLPLFSLLTAYFFIKAFKNKKYIYFLLFGSFLAMSIQLHYLALALLLPILFVGFYDLIKNKKNFIKVFIQYISSVAAFLIFSSPLIIFDLRHNFINFGNLIKLFKSGSGIGGGKLANFIGSFADLNKYLFNTNIHSLILILLLLSVFTICFYFFKQKKVQQSIFLLFLPLMLVVISLYPGIRHIHYLAMTFPFYIVYISLIFSSILSYKKIGILLMTLFLVGFIYLNAPHYNFLWQTPSNQIGQARSVANFLDKIITVKRFNFAVQPDGWQEDSYLYFLELKGKVPVDRKKLEIGDEMFVVCGNPCNIEKTKSWNITMFGKSRLVSHWAVNGVDIYKLVHDISIK